VPNGAERCRVGTTSEFILKLLKKILKILGWRVSAYAFSQSGSLLFTNYRFPTSKNNLLILIIMLILYLLLSMLLSSNQNQRPSCTCFSASCKLFPSIQSRLERKRFLFVSNSWGCLISLTRLCKSGNSSWLSTRPKQGRRHPHKREIGQLSSFKNS